jgi:hypothetical protein
VGTGLRYVKDCGALRSTLRFMGMFELLFEEWQEAERAANSCWAEVCRADEQFRRGVGNGPAPEEVCDALRLRRVACEWHVAIRAHLRNQREQLLRL